MYGLTKDIDFLMALFQLQSFASSIRAPLLGAILQCDAIQGQTDGQDLVHVLRRAQLYIMLLLSGASLVASASNVAMKWHSSSTLATLKLAMEVVVLSSVP